MLEDDTVDVYPSSDPITKWWSEPMVAVVTGANKGIGFALVKELAQQGLTVVLAARNEERGKNAVESLNGEGLNSVHFYCLDVSDIDSIQLFASWFEQTFGVVDILINNAAVSFNKINENSVEYAAIVLKTNFYGSKHLTEALLPMLRCPSGRILNISSRLGSVDTISNPSLKEMFRDHKNLTEEQIEDMIDLFLENVNNKTWESYGWPKLWTDYAVSKLALNGYSRVLAKRYEGRGISINCFCPGFTQTSMTDGVGTHTADDVAKIGARLALLPPEVMTTGDFFVFGSSEPLHAKLKKC